MSTSNSSDAGFTGLEAALVLIAFFVVASVFAYVVLGAGFFSAQQGQSVIRQGIEQAGSSITLTGAVYGISTTPDMLDSLIVPVGLTAGSEPIDFNTVSVRFIGPTHREIVVRNTPLADVVPAQGCWSVQERLNDDGDLLLEAGEQYLLNISPDNRGDCRPHGSFAVEIKPPGRAALRVERTVPGSISRVTRLE